MESGELAAQMTWKEILFAIGHVLNYRLFELDGHGVSLGKLMSGVVLLWIGYWLSGRGASLLDQRVLSRLHIDQALRYTFRRLIFYFFLVISTLFTLHTLNVPVTIFTVLGGALAVGIGFGSQNLVNNFISGILVMVERPIRVGDYIEVESIAGQVQSIGMRSTLIRTGSNAMTIIPNTRFIENNLTNWTMSGTIQSSIRVGVAYGTDTRRFRELCIQVVRQVPQVVQDPSPDVSFVDFGDSALLFDISFAVLPHSVGSRKSIASEIRYRLNDMFVEQGIDLPFPQRQVRLVGTPPST